MKKKEFFDDYYQEPTGRAIIQVNDENGENGIGKSYISPPCYRSTFNRKVPSSLISRREPYQAT